MAVRYLFTSPTTRIASAIAARWRCRPSRSPTVSKPRAYDGQHGLVDRLEVAGGRDLAEALGDHRRGPVDQVAPARDQLGVGALHELRPGEVGVGGLRAGRADEVAQRVGLVARQHVADQDHVAAAGGELLALHRHELAGDHLGGQVQPPELPRLAAPRRPRRCRRAARPARSGSGRRCCPCP